MNTEMTHRGDNQQPTSMSHVSPQKRRPAPFNHQILRPLGLLLLLLSAGLAHAQQPVVFSPPTPYPVGSGPQLIAVGDFNNDTHPDLAVSNQDGTISVLLGDGAGNFSPAQTINLVGRSDTEGIVAGDFDGDGNLDLAAASYGSGAVDILLGNGDGTFRLGTPLTLPDGTGPTYIASTDLNGDNLPDLAVADFNTNQVLIYTGNGDGTFNLLTSLAGNGLSNPEQIVFADFDRDGLLDLAVANKGNGVVSVFQGAGGGLFNPAASVAAGVGSIGLAVGDFDGDGLPDLAVANYGTDAVPGDVVSVLRNNSAGGGISFEGARTLFIGDHLINVVAADFNGDGRVDLAVTSTGNSPANNDVAWLVNTSGGPGMISFTPGGVPVGLNPVGLVTADLNGDGLPDLVNTNNQSNTVSVLLNRR